MRQKLILICDLYGHLLFGRLLFFQIWHGWYLFVRLTRGSRGWRSFGIFFVWLSDRFLFRFFLNLWFWNDIGRNFKAEGSAFYEPRQLVSVNMSYLESITFMIVASLSYHSVVTRLKFSWGYPCNWHAWKHLNFLRHGWLVSCIVVHRR